MSTMTAAQPASRPATNPWAAALYAGIFTAIAGIAFSLLFQAESPILYVLAFLLTGVGPVLGYQMAAGRLGSDWKSIIGGLLGFVLLVLGWILWPILVGALTKGQSIGKLFLWSVIGFVLGVAVLLLIGTVMGQNPGWVAFGWTVGWAVWGGTVGAAMASADK